MKSIDYILIVLLSVGAFQGIVYGSILCLKKGMHFYANRFLAAILFFFSYRLLVETSKIFGYVRYDFWYQVLLEYNWIYGTLLFFFVKSYVNPDFRLKRKDYIHFLPVVIEITWSFFIKSQNFYWDGTRESLSWLGYYGYMTWMHYPTMYIISSALLIYYSSKSQNILSHLPELVNYERIEGKLKWIERVVKVIKVFAIIYIIGILIDYFFFNFSSNLFYGHPVFIGMAIITYWLGIEGFSRRKDSALKPIQQLSDKEQKLLKGIADAIQRMMTEESLYKDPELTLSTLSRKLNQKPYLVTKSLNIILQKKFTDYINELRIEEVKRTLQNPKSNNYTLLSIAYDAGFNSKASFNRAVKKFTGKSPNHLKSNI